MRKHVEYMHLQKMGATDRQIHAYEVSDPMDIYSRTIINDADEREEIYEIEAFGEKITGLTAKEVLAWLNGFADSIEESEQTENE